MVQHHFIGYTVATKAQTGSLNVQRKKVSNSLDIGLGRAGRFSSALHDAPEIQSNIKVYWIGGPNKKWSANSYAYIAANFPNLWIIESNGSYNGFFSDNGVSDSLKNGNYYDRYIRGAGYLGKDYKKYYKGVIKMGDTPSLLYMMDGDPNDPVKESWGGSFEKFDQSSRVHFDRNTTLADTVNCVFGSRVSFQRTDDQYSF
jgi:hypothetical protein